MHGMELVFSKAKISDYPANTGKAKRRGCASYITSNVCFVFCSDWRKSGTSILSKSSISFILIVLDPRRL